MVTQQDAYAFRDVECDSPVSCEGGEVYPFLCSADICDNRDGSTCAICIGGS